MADEIIRKHLVFSGSVQGVGFRWHSKRAAEAVGATGWVRNDWGGTVTMELQGTEKQIDAVIAAIERGSYIRVEGLDARRIPVEKNESGFACADERW